MTIANRENEDASHVCERLRMIIPHTRGCPTPLFPVNYGQPPGNLLPRSYHCSSKSFRSFLLGSFMGSIISSLTTALRENTRTDRPYCHVLAACSLTATCAIIIVLFISNQIVYFMTRPAKKVGRRAQSHIVTVVKSMRCLFA